ncbi:pyrimidine dimer DNA glycosylase/endonuclease V [Gulosibacter bifidus]|uniref:Pyrimidine dimer DNA glycosylase/endonuclease V n=1 Tax=Gulosibacter bifidus TaxID=272239 RepID=A0ABW5RNF3_9MICO|nr:pyrimidine dimer DNA glycosylase/endonuclease V [Gulosibacter bifidus]
MRLWSLHPQHLDRIGLVALWREALLAQAVLHERTKGYRAHPQLERFRNHPDPAAAIHEYLHAVQREATARGYRFDATKIDPLPESAEVVAKIPVTEGQLEYERMHLLRKLRDRAPELAEPFAAATIAPHPLFERCPGPIASWERP